MNSNISIVAHIGQLIRQSAKSPIGGNVACFMFKFGIDVDDNVLKNLTLISRYFELNGQRNITASIAIDLQSIIEDNHVGFTRDEQLQQCMHDMTVNMQSAVVFTIHHVVLFVAPIFFLYEVALNVYMSLGVLRYEIKALLLFVLLLLLFVLLLLLLYIKHRRDPNADNVAHNPIYL